jgi:prepilin-type N-terminal cleavage/methylation domain-containing protein
MRRPSLDRATRKGFTLVEVLIVVVILGILAATVLPQFTSATEDAKESALKQNLQQIRSQIDLYRFQHNGKVPAQGSTLQSDLYMAMLCTTDATGSPDPAAKLSPFNPGAGPFGPYLLGQFPPNPFNGLNSVIIQDTKDTSGNYGWWYSSKTGEIRACLATSADMSARDGTAYNQF